MTSPYPRRPTPTPLERSLLSDGSLRILIDPALLPLLSGWLPQSPDRTDAPGDAAATIRVSSGGGALRFPTAPPTFRFMAVVGWVRPAGEIRLQGDGGCGGAVNLPEATAQLSVPPLAEARAAVTGDLDALATVAAALLLGRLGRVLAHAAGLVHPRGGAWLLVGDTGMGKTTSCANLVRAGWEYLSDDQVVLGREPDGTLRAEGWVRRFNVDSGWGKEGAGPVGRRVQLDARTEWPGRWLEAAPLAGLLFPRVEPASPSVVTPIGPADALSRIVRAMPWLLFDRERAPMLLALLGDVATTPAFALRLGGDVFARPDRLAGLLEPLAGNANSV
jgi:hypothetical protein